MMSPTSAAVLLPVAAAAEALMLMAMASSMLSAAAAAAPQRAPIGLANCTTTCGDVVVPYPFGLGPSRCYWPGLNLTCDTTHHSPQLLIGGDGNLRITEISLRNRTMRVIGGARPVVINATSNFTNGGWNLPFGRGFTEYGYRLSYRNELIVSGCNLAAAILEDSGEETPTIIGGCASLCPKNGSDDTDEEYYLGSSFWNLNLGWCQTPLTTSVPSRLQVKWLYGREKHTVEQRLGPFGVYIVEERWVDENGLVQLVLGDLQLDDAPIVLEWSVTRGLQHRDDCDDDIRSRLCKSQHSRCFSDIRTGFMCQCEDGYDGNPYLTGGCQDIDECKLPSEETNCFGECLNTIGSYYCTCPRRTYGNPDAAGGCVNINSTTADDLLPTVAPAPIGLPNCSTTCGDVSLPYPFGINTGCYWPGFNLTCNTSYNPPRLFLDSNETLEAIDISLADSTVRVIYETSTVSLENSDGGNGNMPGAFNLPDIGAPYMLSNRNEFILYGCDVQATLYGEYINGSSNTSNNSIISRCVSTCSSSQVAGENRGSGMPVPALSQGGYCSGHDGCCHAPISAGSTPRRLEFKGFNTSQQNPVCLFISEEGLTDQWQTIFSKTDLGMRFFSIESSPLFLQWAVKQGFSVPADNSGQCPGDVAKRLCKSEHSNCLQENGGFTCHCNQGYQGNPYIAYGCEDIDECKITKIRDSCFGDCNNLLGYYECHCPRGTHGNPMERGGCVSRSSTGLIIGLSVASGPELLLLVLVLRFLLHKIKQHRIKLLKQQYFKENRGQLLQQLVSQEADIAERMIIPIDELAKATNNFDKARELGGGGHGTVYKGILSNLHVVAIKKSKITVQKEIDEFINEVAILSQINHKNVVKLFGCCLETKVPLLVYEFISNGTLYDHLHVDGLRSLSWGNRLRIATEVASSLAYLHSSVSNPIIHRDIKSSNILLDDALTSKISDFGASRYIPIGKEGLTSRIQGTRGYMDPLCFQTGRLTEKSDVYSFGVLLVELLTRSKPFSYLSPDGDSLAAHFVNLLAQGNVVQIIDPQVVEEKGEQIQEVSTLAASCVNIRGEERPTMRQVEHVLEGLWGTKKYTRDNTVVDEFQNQAEGRRIEEPSRIYSLEQEMMISLRYPR
ncbi:unnamed protein product [Urochloa humidicola]